MRRILIWVGSVVGLRVPLIRPTPHPHKSVGVKKAAQGDFDYHVISALLVEVSGIEPLTSCMPCKRSPS